MILVVTPDRDTGGKRDYTGAFRIESIEFQARHGGVIVRIDQGQPSAARFRQLLHAIEEHQPDTLAYFGHGLRRSLPQLGATLGNVASLAGALALGCTAPLVLLYACSAADGTGPGGEGGFCDALRDALCNAEATGCKVYGHTSAGHTTRNPMLRRFTRDSTLGGEWVVTPGSKLWARWRAALQGPMRLDFGFLSQHELEARLTPPEA